MPLKPRKGHKKPGQPSKYTQAIGDKVCELIASGHSLNEVAAKPGMPAKSQILRWAAHSANAQFCNQYTKAMEIRLEGMADDIHDIADNGRNDWMERNGQQVTNPEALNRSRLRCDVRKWTLARLLPKKYGDKIQQEISGQDGTPLAAVIRIVGSDKPNA